MKTHPEDDGVLSLEDGDELVSAGDFGLVQWPKSTQHLDVAFRVGISHCAGKNSGRRDEEREFPPDKGKEKRTKYSSRKGVGASATAPASNQRLAGGAFGRKFGQLSTFG